ncbi:hypothetical protein [Microbacterium xanthum]|uniref:hypothetical protein n=1 Tax=Microbacterium xanthum TaxID=3079794 RepID=UPI002AD4228C|nr:hypothetical protein [Microbacterium sp. KSW-48]MDZ8170779.1 hypothetical protein [Microbacterium sp. KSW-48]
MRTPSLALTAVATVAVAALALTGCTAGTDDASRETPVAEPTATPDVEQTPEAEVASLADCAVGTWLIPEAEMVRFYGTLSEQVDQIEIAPYGTVELTLGADGASSYDSDFGFDLTVEAGPTSMEPRVSVTGSVSGTWATTDDDRITLDTDDSSLVVDATVDGQPMDLGDLTNQFLEHTPLDGSAGPVTCTDDTMVVPYETAGDPIDLTWQRIAG